MNTNNRDCASLERMEFAVVIECVGCVSGYSELKVSLSHTIIHNARSDVGISRSRALYCIDPEWMVGCGDVKHVCPSTNERQGLVGNTVNQIRQWTVTCDSNPYSRWCC